MSIFRDITHLIELDRLKSEFVATVSHELRTPLTSIKGYVDILLMGAAGTLNDQQENFLQVVQDNTERLNILVNDLLEVSRMEAGKVDLDLRRVDISQIAGEITTDYLLRAQKEGKPLRIQVQQVEPPLFALGDPARIHQILENLINNAYSYTSQGGLIEIGFVDREDKIQVDIRDSGVGIPLEDQDRIFERFYRGEAPLVSTTAGTGLGLSIVQYLVELHGGRIWLESDGIPGQGSTFSFTLPKYPTEEH